MPLSVRVIALSLVANFIGSENFVGLTGAVACKGLIPAVLLDPLGAAASLVLLGVLLSRYSGQFSTFSGVIIDRYGSLVGGLASFMSLFGSLLWAGAQYKAILEIIESLGVVPKGLIEPTVVVCLWTWAHFGGLVADVWMDSISMLAVGPCICIVGVYALSKTPSAALVGEYNRAAAMLPTTRAANTFAVGMLGNLFTEELAGRVLLAESPRRARLACMCACLIFLVIGLAPAALGIWASSVPGLLIGEDGVHLCNKEGGKDHVLAMSLGKLSFLQGSEKALYLLLLVESLNTLDTSILMCAQVMELQLQVNAQGLARADWLPTIALAVSVALVAGVSKLGDDVWELGEYAVASVGAPLTVLCFFLPFQGVKPDNKAAFAGMLIAQLIYLGLIGLKDGTDDEKGMPFVWAVVGGITGHALVRCACNK